MTLCQPLRVSTEINYKSKSVTLIDPESRTFAVNIGEKREMIAGGGPLIAVWQGQWRADAFEVDIAVAKEHLDSAPEEVPRCPAHLPPMPRPRT